MIPVGPVAFGQGPGQDSLAVTVLYHHASVAPEMSKGVASPKGEGRSSNRTGVDLRTPPPRRLPGPIIDAHAHVGHPRLAELFVEAARAYHVDQVLSISAPEDADALRDRYGSFFDFYYRVLFDEKDDPDTFEKLTLERIHAAAEKDFKALKFWFKPQFNYEAGVRFDDPLMYPIFESAGRYGLPCLMHIADPDLWFERVYNDPRKYGTKPDNYHQFTNAFRDFPDVTFIGAHLAGDPEHLGHLQELLDEFPNLVLDCSATKWVARELSRKPEEARAFFVRNSDRIMFGTDLVTFPGIDDFERYASRYWVHQMLWETDVRCESPIDDPDCEGPPRICGLDLPEEVLEKLLWRNAVRIFRIPKPEILTGLPSD